MSVRSNIEISDSENRRYKILSKDKREKKSLKGLKELSYNMIRNTEPSLLRQDPRKLSIAKTFRTLGRDCTDFL